VRGCRVRDCLLEIAHFLGREGTNHISIQAISLIRSSATKLVFDGPIGRSGRLKTLNAIRLIPRGRDRLSIEKLEIFERLAPELLTSKMGLDVIFLDSSDALGRRAGVGRNVGS
jgi:hypothetical protein